MAGRRSTDSNASQPVMKVVGFRVEGVPPSPAQDGLLQDNLMAGGGSPDPVIIPPSFQSEARQTSSVSPERLNTLPSFIPQQTDGAGVMDILSSGLSMNVHGPTPPDLNRYSPRRALAHTGSLPPMSGDVTSDWKRYAASIARTSPTQLSPRTLREVRSQPVSANTTPPVSPFRPDTEGARPSASYRQSMFDPPHHQSRPEASSQQAATFTDGARLPERVRKIQVHMGGTYSDGAKMPPVDTSKHDIGTPRLQHGFQVQPDTARQGTPFANPTPTATPASSGEPHTESPKRRTGKGMPAVPEVLTSSAVSRGPSGNYGKEAQLAQSRTAAAEVMASRPKDAKQPVEAKSQTQGTEVAGETSRRSEQGAGKGAEKKATTTKAERRALQERQRAEKAAVKEAEGKQRGQVGANQASGSTTRREGPVTTPRTDDGAGSRSTVQASPLPSGAPKQPQKAKSSKQTTGRTSEMFAHLPKYKAIKIDNVFQESTVAAKVHPAVLQLGLHCADGTINGGNARCLAMLLAFKNVIQDYQTPESKELSRDLTSQLNVCIQFLVECRPLSVSMGTAIKNLKLKVSHISAATPQDEAKLQLLEEIDTFIQEKITFADEQVARIAQTKVVDGDAVLTFGFSSAVLNTLLAAKRGGKKFRVVVTDSRPNYEGKALLTKLLDSGIPCTYIHLNALCFIMQEVTKVFLGAAGAMSNGTIIAKAGAASVAMVADAMQRPVIVCCETIKFVDRVQLDSITYNELGDPERLAAVPERPELAELQDWSEQPQLELLNLTYDAMPCDYVSMIVTEVGAIPPTSIPVVLREYRTAPKM